MGSSGCRRLRQFLRCPNIPDRVERVFPDCVDRTAVNVENGQGKRSGTKRVHRTMVDSVWWRPRLNSGDVRLVTVDP